MTALNRRKLIIERMNALESQGLDCRGCQGTCCTYEANSMMTTPLEALELLNYLKDQGELTQELKDKCLETIRKYRLDHPAGNGRKSFLRRTYTCPFFNHQELGCPLPREVKPYGCLAFNAHHAEIKAKEHCFSEIDVLEKREAAFPNEEAFNEVLKKKFNIFWDKTPLPLALIELWNTEISDEDLKFD